jgi:hypothetical protein
MAVDARSDQRDTRRADNRVVKQFLCPQRHPERNSYLNNLAHSLQSRFDYQVKFNNFREAISV